MLVLAVAAGMGFAGSRPSQVDGREVFELDIYTHQTGTFTHVLGVAIAEVLNEVLPWVRAVSVESMGSIPNEQMMYDANDYKRQHTMYFGTLYNAYMGNGPFEGRRHTSSKIAFNFSLVMGGLATTNPAVHRLQDLEGRTIGIRAGVSAAAAQFVTLIESGVRTRMERLDFNAATEAILSGTVEAILPNWTAVTPDLRQWTGNPATMEFLARARHVGFIDFPIDVDRRLRSTPGGPLENFYQMVVPIPPLTVDPRQTNVWYGVMANGPFAVDQIFSEDILFELMTTLHENKEKLTNYHPQGAFLSPETMALYTYPSEFHPGAMRFYNSVGATPTSLEDFMEKLSRN